MTSSNSNPVNASKTQTAAYEFTKRKRWTDTLFSETSEAVFLIISPSFKILYCSSAVIEILGWKEDQLVDADLRSFIEQEDLDNFMWAFTEVLRLGNGLFTYTRLKFEHPPTMTSVPSLLFEVKGRVHYFQGQPHAPCAVFLSAMPYPNRDMTLLNSFLGLKMENESLSRRIREMKCLVGARDMLTAVAQPQSSRYAQGEDSPESMLGNSSVYFASKVKSTPYASYIYSESLKSELPNCNADYLASASGFEDLSFGPDGDYDEVQRKKKKTITGEEQRVCMKCGRTDSPEWRKGPHGPKTLCNACGLRWAKSTRKDEPEIATAPKTSTVLLTENSSTLGLVNNKHMLF